MSPRAGDGMREGETGSIRPQALLAKWGEGGVRRPGVARTVA